jgi:hypothetical protein
MADIKSMLDRYGLDGVNKPKRQTSGGKSHVVLAKEGDEVKLIRFGQAGVKTNQTVGQREAKGKMSAAYWADKVKWSPSKTASPSKKWVKGS